MELGLWVNSIALNFWVESMLVNVGTTGVPGMNPTCVHLRGELNPKTKCQPPRSLSRNCPHSPPLEQWPPAAERLEVEEQHRVAHALAIAADVLLRAIDSLRDPLGEGEGHRPNTPARGTTARGGAV